MNSKTIADGILRALAILGALVFLFYFIYQVRSVLVYITIAAVISLIGRPFILFFKNRLKMKNTLAVVLTILIMVGILIGIISLFIPLIVQQGQNLSLLDLESLRGRLEDLFHQFTEYIGITSIELKEQLKDSIFQADLNLDFIPNFLNSFVGTLGSFSVGLFSVIFIAFFFLKDSGILQNMLLALIPDNQEDRVVKSLGKIKDLLSRYFIGLVMQITILFVIYTAVLLIFGIENAVVIAFLCALLNLIPYIGPIIGGLLMATLTMTSNLGADFSTVILPKTVYVMIGFVIGQLVDNFFSQPFIFSNSVRSHPLEIFLIIIIGGLLFGITGMIIAVPGYTAIKVILKEFLAENKIVKSLTKDL